MVLLTSTVLFFSACNSGDKTAEEVKDSAVVEVAPPPPPAPQPLKSVMVIWHKVANYTTWLAGYEAHDSARLAAGLHNYVVGRDLSDSNMVMVALGMDDLAKAKAFAASADLKATMQKLGVGVPSISYMDVQMLDTTTNPLKTRVMFSHKVKDYDVFKKTFDSHKQARIDAGMTDRVVGSSFDDKNDVTIVLAVNDLAKAKAFTSSASLKNKMAEAGVVGAPVVHFYTVAKVW